jgi:hypothetical protein
VAASPLARETWTPVTRCSASETVLSGSLPISSATIESVTATAFSLSDCADRRLLRMPVTTIVSSDESSAVVVPDAGWSCAAAGAA